MAVIKQEARRLGDVGARPRGAETQSDQTESTSVRQRRDVDATASLSLNLLFNRFTQRDYTHV